MWNADEKTFLQLYRIPAQGTKTSVKRTITVVKAQNQITPTQLQIINQTEILGFLAKFYAFLRKQIAAPKVVKNPANGKIVTAYFFGI